MRVFLRKYNTLLVTGNTAIRVPMIKRGVVDFAVGADWTPAAGDVKVRTDNGGVANITNLPTAIAMGNTAEWEFILTAAELSGKQITVTVADSATKAVEDQMFIVETYGNASAMYPTDFAASILAVNTTQVAGTAQTARDLGANIDVATSTRLAPTTAGRTLDVSTGGEAGLDWANIGSPTTAVGLTGTTIATSQVVASVSGAIGSLGATAKSDVNAEVLDVLTVDTFAEPGAVPAATSTLKDKLNWVFAMMRNKRTQTATTQLIRNDGDSATIGSVTVSDDGTTFVRGKAT